MRYTDWGFASDFVKTASSKAFRMLCRTANTRLAPLIAPEISQNLTRVRAYQIQTDGLVVRESPVKNPLRPLGSFLFRLLEILLAELLNFFGDRVLQLVDSFAGYRGDLI